MTDLKSENARGLPFVLVGTSGSGKSTLCGMLEQRGLGKRSISYTTREMRSGEQEGKDYFFVSERKFTQLIENGDLLEHAIVHGRMYGTSHSRLKEALDQGATVFLDIDIQGALQVRDRHPGTQVIFILPPSFDILVERLSSRAREDQDEIQRRLRNGLEELLSVDRFDYLIVNEDLERSCSDIVGILKDCSSGMKETGASSRLLTRNQQELVRKWKGFAKNRLKYGDG